MKRVVIVDIDGTLSNDRWRQPKNDDISWDEFHAMAKEDTTYEDMINFIGHLSSKYYIIGLTGRPEKFRQMTTLWLGMNVVAMDELHMRPDDDYRKAPDLKVAIALEMVKPPDKIILVIDNDTRVIEAFNALGTVTTMLVNAK